MFLKQFTDVHGVTHAAAVFQVDGVNMYGNSNKSLTLDELGIMQENESVNSTVDFSARFWASQEAKDAGKLPMAFSVVDAGGLNEQTTFNLSELTAPFEMDKADIVAAAETLMKSLITQGQ